MWQHQEDWLLERPVELRPDLDCNSTKLISIFEAVIQKQQCGTFLNKHLVHMLFGIYPSLIDCAYVKSDTVTFELCTYQIV